MSSLAAEKAKLKARLAEIEAEEKAEAEERFKIIGRVVSDAMKSDQSLNDQITRLLGENVTKKNERKRLGLPEKGTAAGYTSGDRPADH